LQKGYTGKFYKKGDIFVAWVAMWTPWLMVLAGGVCLVGHHPGTVLGKEFQNLPSRQEKH
jgi:hypothetical protein